MADDSKFVLRWEIDNAKARFATGKVESQVFDKGGFEWTVTVERNENGNVVFTLRCESVRNRKWKCEADVGMKLLNVRGAFSALDEWKERACFNENSCSLVPKTSWSWSPITNNRYLLNDTVTFELHVNIISSERVELTAELGKFAEPNEMSNVILKIGEEKLHVSKEYLSIHSPVFKNMFFGEFAEKGKDEVELKDIVYEEFLDLLNVIYFKMLKITDRTVVHILKLADRFQMKDVIKLATINLTEAKGIDVMKKLLVADQYNLSDVKFHCLRSFNNATEMLKLVQEFPECDNFSSDMKVALFDRLKKLKLQ